MTLEEFAKVNASIRTKYYVYDRDFRWAMIDHFVVDHRAEDWESQARILRDFVARGAEVISVEAHDGAIAVYLTSI